MKKCNFKVGDKVIIKEWDEMVKEYGKSKSLRFLDEDVIMCTGHFTQGMKKLCGAIATIKRDMGEYIELSFDNKNLFTNYNFSKDMIKPIRNNQTIVIYQKDNRVIAKDKTTNRTAMAICSSEDEFNFKIGALIAFERLVGKGSIDKARKAVDAAKEEQRKKIKIGDSVRIIDANKQANSLPISWTEFDDDFKVVAIGYNSKGNEMCVIKNKSKGIYAGYYLFDIDGLKKC